MVSKSVAKFGGEIMPIMTGCTKGGKHSYPQEMVSFIFDLWKDPLFVERITPFVIDASFQLPDRAILEQVISTCYQASLLKEEERPVRFRLIIRAPEHFPANDGPPTGLHRLQFSRPRPFNEYELYRLAPAADFYRSLIGISLDPEEGAQI